MPDEKLSRRKLLKRGLAFGTLALAGDAFALEPNWIEVERITVPIRDLPPAFESYRISLLSDIHWPRYTSRRIVDRAIGLAMDFKPDLIVVPGDICDNAPTYETPLLQGIFDGLKSPDGVFGTLGNHDHMLDVPALRREIAANTPIELIDNRHHIIRRKEEALAIAGVGDLWKDDVNPIAALSGIDESIPRILLSHNPDVAENFPENLRVDLQISGHTHGGEVRIPFGHAPFTGSRYDQKYLSGLVEGPRHRVYITRGVCSVKHVRFNCRPEVTWITLKAT